MKGLCWETVTVMYFQWFGTCKYAPVTNGSCEINKDRTILVERDKKFELLSLQDIESQGFLPPNNNANSTENDPQQLLPRSSNSCVSGIKKEDSAGKIDAVTHSSTGQPLAYIPQPPLNCKTCPTQIEVKGMGNLIRTESARISPVTSTYCLSPWQKERQKQLEQQTEKLKRKEEQQKIEEEKEKKRGRMTWYLKRGCKRKESRS